MISFTYSDSDIKAEYNSTSRKQHYIPFRNGRRRKRSINKEKKKLQFHLNYIEMLTC